MKNTNCAPISKYLFFFLFLWQLNVFAQDSLRVMSYNLMLFPDGTSFSRVPYLRYIVDAYKPDIFAVCEVETENASDTILQHVLQPVNPAYRAAAFEWSHSNPNGTLQQMLYYNSDKLELTGQTYLTTNVRDINHYTLILKTTEMATDTVFLDVYVMHLKASGGQTNEQKRLNMVNVLTADLANIPPDHHVLVVGDFNLYRSSEPAYTELTDTTNAVVLKDPVNRPGYWHNNSAFADLHTQSPNTNKGGNYVGGGLDDRFDFILVSSEMMQPSQNLYYATGSYAAFGNNGNCFNDDINDTACSGRYSQTLRDNLWNMSDHIPVVATFYTAQHFAVPAYAMTRFSVFPNPSSDYISLGKNAHGHLFRITDVAGKIVKTYKNYKGEKWYIGDLKAGLYYVVPDSPYMESVPFVKE